MKEYSIQKDHNYLAKVVVGEAMGFCDLEDIQWKRAKSLFSLEFRFWVSFELWACLGSILGYFFGLELVFDFWLVLGFEQVLGFGLVFDFGLVLGFEWVLGFGASFRFLVNFGLWDCFCSHLLVKLSSTPSDKSCHWGHSCHRWHHHDWLLSHLGLRIKHILLHWWFSLDQS